MKTKLPLIKMSSSVAIWSTWVLVLKVLDLPGILVTGITLFTGSLGLLMFVAVFRNPGTLMALGGERRLLRLTATVGILDAAQTAIFLTAFNLAVEQGGAVLIILIRSFIGITTPLLAVVVSKEERFSGRLLLFGMLATIGAVLIFGWGGIEIGEQVSIAGIIMVFLSVGMLSVQYLLQRSLAIEMTHTGQSGVNVITWQAMISALFMLPLMAGNLILQPGLWNEISGWQIALTGMFGFTHVSLPFVVRINAMRQLKAQLCVIIAYLEPVLSVAFSILILGERVTPGFFLGAVMIIGSALSASLLSSNGGED